MKTNSRTLAAWGVAVLLVVLPWTARSNPEFAPGVVVLALALYGGAASHRKASLWANPLVLASAVGCQLASASWRISAGWLILAMAVVLIGFGQPRRWCGGRPDIADLVALTGWATAFIVEPRLIEAANGGWITPLLLVIAARNTATQHWHRGRPLDKEPTPATRSARGTLSLRGIVLGSEGLPRSVPIELELRAGASLAVLVQNPVDAEILAGVIAGRIKPLEGEVAIDAVPIEVDDRLVACIQSGERFLRGGIEVNLAAMGEEDLESSTVAAVMESCRITEVAQELDGGMIDVDGAPLSRHHRMLLQAARVVPSNYRVVVVNDPMAWLNAVEGEIWRKAVVRACVGRTAVWLTVDRALAKRASMVMELRHGSLRPYNGDLGG